MVLLPKPHHILVAFPLNLLTSIHAVGCLTNRTLQVFWIFAVCDQETWPCCDACTKVWICVTGKGDTTHLPQTFETTNRRR